MTRAAGNLRAPEPLYSLNPLDSYVEHRQSAVTIAVRPWGFDGLELASWVQGLSSLDGLLRWTISHDRTAAAADVVVHLVRPSTRDADVLCWNCVGANRAMINALGKKRPELVLFAGHVGELPRGRARFWSAAGSLPPCAALDAMGRMIGASAMSRQGGVFAVRMDLLVLMARRVDASSSKFGDDFFHF